jgi:hypothetical protein
MDRILQGIIDTARMGKPAKVSRTLLNVCFKNRNDTSVQWMKQIKNTYSLRSQYLDGWYIFYQK